MKFRTRLVLPQKQLFLPILSTVIVSLFAAGVVSANSHCGRYSEDKNGICYMVNRSGQKRIVVPTETPNPKTKEGVYYVPTPKPTQTPSVTTNPTQTPAPSKTEVPKEDSGSHGSNQTPNPTPKATSTPTNTPQTTPEPTSEPTATPEPQDEPFTATLSVGDNKIIIETSKSLNECSVSVKVEKNVIVSGGSVDGTNCVMDTPYKEVTEARVTSIHGETIKLK